MSRDMQNWRAWHLRTHYGITLDQLKEMEHEQGGRCAICRRLPKTSLHVDHNHVTGQVRGLLCSACNRGVGYLQDSPVLLQRAAEYLTRTQ